MRYNNLSQEEKKELQEIVLDYSNKIGGKNYFLQMIENIRESKQFPLLNKTAKFHYNSGTISWKKEIYKEKIKAIKSILKAIPEDNLYNCKEIKLKKEITNTIKTLGKLEFIVKPNDSKDGEGFTFKPFNTIDSNNVEFTPIFQIIFLDSVNNTKKILIN